MDHRYRVSEEQFKQIQNIDGWNCTSIPRDQWDQIPAPPSWNDTLAVMVTDYISDRESLSKFISILCSGQSLTPTLLNLSILKYDDRFLVYQLDDDCCPYLLHGPIAIDFLRSDGV